MKRLKFYIGKISKTIARNSPALLLVVAMGFGINSSVSAQKEAGGFTQADRELMIRMDERIGSLQKQMDTRFAEVDKRFDNLYSVIWILSGVFSVITASTIGFAIWDRRTMIRPFETKVKQIEASIEMISTQTETQMGKIISTLRELAKTDNKVAEVLKSFNLL